MSYILDALRKSDQQRQRGTAPTLLAAQTAAAVAPEQRALLAYGLLAALLVVAGILIGWLRPWQPEQAPPRRQEPVASKPVESPPRESAPAPPEMASQPMAEPKLQSATRPELVTPAPSEISPQSKLQPNLQNATTRAGSTCAIKSDAAIEAGTGRAREGGRRCATARSPCSRARHNACTDPGAAC